MMAQKLGLASGRLKVPLKGSQKALLIRVCCHGSPVEWRVPVKGSQRALPELMSAHSREG